MGRRAAKAPSPLSASPLTGVREHVPLQGAGPGEDPRAVRAVDLLQAVGIRVALCPQQPVLGRAALLLVAGPVVICGGCGHLVLGIVLRTLQKRAELVGVRGGQHLLDAGELPAGV